MQEESKNSPSGTYSFKKNKLRNKESASTISVPQGQSENKRASSALTVRSYDSALSASSITNAKQSPGIQSNLQNIELKEDSQDEQLEENAEPIVVKIQTQTSFVTDFDGEVIPVQTPITSPGDDNSIFNLQSIKSQIKKVLSHENVSKKEPVKEQKIKHKKLTIDDFISFTRQRDLPPKDPVEEERHLSEHKQMLKLMRQKSMSEQKYYDSRQKHLIKSERWWVSNGLLDFKKVKNSKICHRYWRLGLPDSVRSRVWILSQCGCYKVTKDVIQFKENQGRIDSFDDPTINLLNQAVSIIEEEYQDKIKAVLVNLISTQENFKYDNDLVQIIKMVYNVTQDEIECFRVSKAIIQHDFIQKFHQKDEASLKFQVAYGNVFNQFLAQYCPDAFTFLITLNIRSMDIAQSWFQSFFIHILPIDMVIRMFDLYLLYGEVVIFRIAVAIVSVSWKQLIPLTDSALILNKMISENIKFLDDRQFMDTLTKLEQCGLDEQKYLRLLANELSKL